MTTLFEKLIYTEIPQDFSHPLIKPLSVIWGAATSALLFGLIFMFGSVENFQKAFHYFESKEQKVFLYIFLAFVVFGFMYRLYYAVQGILQHDKRLNEKLEDRYIAFVISSVFVQNFFIGILFSLLFWVLFFQGMDFITAIKHSIDLNYLSGIIQKQINRIPTLIELPYFVALIASHVLMSLVGYAWHRLSHESRLLWLLAHRPHHVSTTLCSATVFEADPKFPLGLAWNILMFGIIGGTISKLISGEFYFVELMMIQMVVGTLEIHNHVSAYYEACMKNKPLLFVMQAVGGQGPYHYVHHSSAPEDTIVNIGGGYFLLWDRIFGTFKNPPEKKPPIGLTNQPEIYFNPFNLALSGLLQILFELKHNPLSLWPNILLGSVYYVPPLTKRFLFKNK